MDADKRAKLIDILLPIFLRIEAQGNKGLSYFCLHTSEKRIVDIVIKANGIKAVKGNGDIRLFIVDKQAN